MVLNTVPLDHYVFHFTLRVYTLLGYKTIQQCPPVPPTDAVTVGRITSRREWPLSPRHGTSDKWL